MPVGHFHIPIYFFSEMSRFDAASFSLGFKMWGNDIF
jgi:hypothetical protein